MDSCHFLNSLNGANPCSSARAGTSDAPQAIARRWNSSLPESHHEIPELDRQPEWRKKDLNWRELDSCVASDHTAMPAWKKRNLMLRHPEKQKSQVKSITWLFILAETEGFEPSMGLYTPYSLSRGAPSASRSRFLRRLNYSPKPARFTPAAPDPVQMRGAAYARPVPCTFRRSRRTS